LEVVSGGARVPVGGPRQQRILAMALAHNNRWVTARQLIDCVWPTDPPATAQVQVRNAVGALRRALVAAGLRSADLRHDVGGYVLDTGGSVLDRQVFGELVAQARLLASAGDLAAAAGTLRTADDLWRGPAMAGLADGPLEIEAVRLEELRLHVSEERVAIELALGRHDTLVPELIRLAGNHPGRDRLQHALLVALCRAGRPADALLAFDRLRQRLATELGVEPSPQLWRLRREILAGRGAGRPPRERRPGATRRLRHRWTPAPSG
jgi:DNA-binding SARP family transcriptional activator